MCNANTPSMNGGSGSQPWDESIPGVGGSSAAPGSMGSGSPQLDWLRRHLALTKSTPITASGPTPDFTPGQGTTTDPQTGLQMPAQGQITQASGGTTSQTQIGTQTSPTKLGSLMRVLAPVLQGGLIGWAGGKGHPGGGFGASNDFFAQRRALQMQYAMMSRQLGNDQFRNMLEYARTQHTLNQPNFQGRSVMPVAAQDAQGRTIYMERDPYSGKWQQVQGFTPPDKPDKPDQTELSTDSTGNQVIVNKTKATARPVLREDSGDSGAGEVQTGLPTRPSGSTSPAASPGAIKTGASSAQGSGAGLPLGPKQKRPSGWRTQAEEDAAAEYRSKNPDASAADVLRYVSTLTREPKDNGLSPKEYRARQASLIGQLNTGFREIENQRQRSIKSLGEFPDPNDVSQIESDTADSKQSMHQRMVDSANAMGIDIGTVPNYRALLQGGGASSAQALPRTPSSGAGNNSASPARPKGVPADAAWNPDTNTWQLKTQGQSGNGKILDDDTAQKIFAEAGRDPVKARQLATQRGYRIQGGGPTKGTTKYYQGVPYVFDGSKYVRSSAGAGGAQ